MMDLSRQRLVNRPVSGGDRATYWEIVRWAAVGAMFVGLILVYSWNQMEILSIQYQMEEQQRLGQELRKSNTALRAEFNSLTNPEKISRQAAEMGLISSNQPRVRIIQAGARPSGDQVAEAWKKPTLHE